MNKILYSKLLFYPLFLLLANVSYGQVTLVNSGSTEFCEGDSITLSTDSPFDTYLWSTGETTESIVVYDEGDYYVTVTDNQSNEFNSDIITITVVSISASASITDLICNGDNDGEIDIDVFDGQSPYTFLWSTGGTTEDLTGLSGGTYTVTITDDNGCTGSVTFTVNEPAAVSITATITDISCLGGVGEIDITVNGGVPDYTYEWSNGETTEDISGLAAGTYALTVLDLFNCIVTDSYTILEDVLEAPVITGISQVCTGANTTLDAGAGYTGYLWSDGSSTQTITVGAGTYSVTVTNTEGCSANSPDFEVTEFTAPVVAITPDGATSFCDGGSVNLAAATGFSSYLWSTGDATDNITAALDGSYTVTVTDDNGCTATAEQTVTVYPNPVLDIIALSDALCKDDANGVIEAEGNGGTAPYLYDFNGGGFSATSSFTGLTAGTYDITVQDDNGCTSLTQFVINEPADYLTATFTTVDVLAAGDATGEIDLSVTGGTSPYAFEWSNGETTEDLADLLAGDYTVTVTDDNGCETSLTITINEPAVVDVVLVNSGSDVLCNGDSVTLSTNIPFDSYLWSTGETTASIVVYTEGDYSVVVTDNQANTYESDIITITVVSISASASITDLICNGDNDGEIDIDVFEGQSPYSFLWSNGEITEDLTGLSGGTYTVTITDDNGCSASVSFDVNEPEIISVSATVTDATCLGGDGEIDIAVSGGTPDYAYEWSNGETTEDLAGLSAGSYTVTVTDFNNCVATDSYTILEDVLEAPVITGISQVCTGANTTLDAGAGYTGYLWSDGSSTQTITVGAGTYSVTVTNTEGCSANSPDFEVTEFTAPVVAITPDGATSFCDGGSVNLAAATGFSSYLWSTGDATDNITAALDGSYTVTVTDDNGCTATAEQTVTVYPNPVLDIIALSDALCKDDANGVIEAEGNGGTAPYLYDFNGGGFSATSSFTGLTAGTYDITVQDDNGCTSLTQFVINEPADYLTATFTTVDVLAAGDATGEIDLSVTGGTSPYAFEWSNGETTEDLADLLAGDYTVTVTDDNGCETSLTITINEPAVVDVVLVNSGSDVLCNGDSVTLSTNIPFDSYLWSTGETTASIVVYTEGDYSVVVTDNQANTYESDIITITVVSISASASITDLICNGDNDGEIDIDVFEGQSPYSFLWSNGEITEDLTGLSGGTYTVTITDDNGCSASVSFDVNEPEIISVSATVTDATCLGADGEIDIAVSGGTPDYAYEWSNGETTEDLAGLSAGSYTVTVTDFNNCVATDSYTILEDVLEAPVITGISQVCTGANTTLDAGAGYTGYLWSDGSSTQTITVGAGTYSVTVTNTEGCSANSPDFEVTEFTAPVVAITPDGATSFCDGGSVNLAAATGFSSYLWSTGDATDNITAALDGSYTVTVTDDNGCTATAEQTVTVYPNPVLDIIALSDALCKDDANGVIEAEGNGGTAPYLYDFNGGGFSATSSFTGLTAGTYDITVQDDNGCTSLTQFVINEPADYLTATFTTVDVLAAGDATGEIDLSVTGGTSPYAFEWSNGETTEDLADLLAGDYTVTVTDDNGCETSLTITINEPAVVDVVLVNSGSDVLCNGDSVTLSTNIPFDSYLWSTGETTASIVVYTEGDYSVVVTDNQANTYESDIITITVVSISASASITDLICNGDNDGEIDIDVFEGQSPYSFLWSNGEITEDLTGLSGGTYTVTITDDNGCSASVSFDVNEPEIISVSATVTDATCLGGDGEIDIAVSGGTPDYAYEWSNGETTEDLAGLSAGSYTVTVTDFNNCVATDSYTILEDVLEAPVITGISQVCTGANTTLDAGAGYTGYLWSDGSSTQTITVGAGTYSVTVTNTEGCSANSPDFEVTEFTAPVVAITPDGATSFCDGGSVNLAAATGFSSYLWSTGDATDNITAALDGSYTVTVTDDNGCTATAEQTVTVYPNPVLDIIALSDALCKDDANGVIEAEGNGGTAPYLYDFNGGGFSATSSFTGLTAGTYDITVQDDNGCTSLTQFVINEPADYLTATFTTVDVLAAGDATGEIDLSVTGGTSPYAFEWSNGETTEDLADLLAGDYTVTVTDDNGCETSLTITINEPAVVDVVLVNSGSDVLCNGDSVTLSTNIPFDSYLWSTGETTASIVVYTEGDYSVIVTDNQANTYESDIITITVVSISASASITDLICNGDNDGEIDIDVFEGQSPYSFLWSNGEITEDLTGLSGGTYTVTITDDNGCSASVTFDLNEPAAIVIASSVTDESCTGGDGEIDIAVSGGTGAYSFEWSNGETTEDLAGLSAGTYTVIVTDFNGCVATDNYNIQGGSNIQTPVITGDNLVCSGNTTTLDAGAGYTGYLWSDGSSTQTITVGAGTYSVTVTNTEGCSANSPDFEVTEFTAPVVAITPDGATSFCDGGSVNLAAATGFSSYLWSTGDATDNITAALDGSYTVTVTDDNGCTATAEQTVTVYPNPVLDIIALSDALCKDDANGVIEAEGNGGTAPYLYDFNGGGFSATSSFTGLTAGTYDITVQDDNGCTSLTQFVINEPADYLGASYSTTDVLCNGDATGSIDISITGGTEPYTYLWSNGDTNEDISDLVAGIYTITVTDANGCELIFAIDIFEPDQLVVGTDYTNISCYGGSDGTAIVYVSGGTPDYAYSWDTNPVQTDFIAFDLGPGIHTITITDANGCILQQPFLISEPAQVISTTSITDATCFGASDGSIEVNATGGTPFQLGEPYIYSWNTIPVQTNATATGLTAGSYTLTITDSMGCITYVVATVNEPNELMVSTSDINAGCNGSNNGQSTAIVSGGTPPYDYSWNTVPVQTTLIATGLTAGLYTVTVTDANGCITSVNTLISESSALILNENMIPVSCFGGTDGSIQVNVIGGTPGYTYFWNTNPSQTTDNLINIPAGTYTVIVTDAGGCTQSASYTVTEPDQINANETATPVTCFGGSNGSISLTTTGGTSPYTIIWSNGNTTSSVTGLTAGSYTVTITDFNGCVETKTIVMSEPDEIIITPVVSNVSCNGGADGSAILTVIGGTSPYSYLWSDGSTDSQLSNLSAGDYTVTVTDANGCTASLDIPVTQPNALSCICNSNVVNVSCNGGSDGSITATPSGGTAPYSYAWSNGQLTQTINGLTAGTYTVTITDANGCQATGIITITEPAALFAFAVSSDITCNGAANGTANVFVNGGSPPYSYSWNTVPVQTTQVATGLMPGTFTVTVTDSKNCTVTSTVTISEPTSLGCSTSVTNTTCNGSHSGTATVVASGGTSPYTYLWNTIPAKTTTTVIGLGAGTYTVTVTDAQGCTTSCQATITQPSSLAAIYVPTNITCNGAATGAIDLTVTGGSAPYQYNWSNGATTEDLIGLTAGIYTVSVTDSKGCHITAIIILTEPPVLSCSSTSTNVNCFGGSNGSATVSVNGGAAPYQYLWSNGGTTSSLANLLAGSYTVTVTDHNNCTTICNVTITQPAILACSVHACCDTIKCYGDHNGTLDVIVNGGTPPYSYTWNTVPVQTNSVATGLNAGSYTVIVTDSKGCTTSCGYILTQPDPLTCNIIANTTVCTGGNDGTATANVSGGTAPYAYVWNTLVAQTTSTATGLSSGTYTVFITDANGCTSSCSVSISASTPPNCSISGNSSICFGGSTQLCAPSGLASYLWSTGATTQCITVSTAATFTVTVTNANGCTSSCNKTITVNAPPSCLITGNSSICSGGSTQLCAPAGLSAYLWNTGATTQCITVNSAATYTVTVTNANGCTSSCNKTVTTNALPDCKITGSGSLCSGSSVQLCGDPGFTSYLWNTGATTQCITISVGGTYTLTITNAGGCSSSCSKTITANNLPNCSISGNSSICFGGSTQLCAPSGLASYLWSTGATTQCITVSTAATFTVTVTNANGCTSSCNKAITVNAPPSCLITGNSSICSGGSTQLCAPAGLSAYLWNTGATTQCITVNSAATYTVTITNANGCTSSCNKTVTTNALPDCKITGSGSLCSGSSVQLCGDPGFTSYLWNTGATTQCITISVGGTYTLTITNAGGCSSSCSKTITANNLPNCSISGNSSICFGGSTQLCAPSGLASYLWSTGATTQCITVSTAATFTVTVTNANGCTSSCNKVITVNAPPSCLITGNSSICSGGSTQLCAPAGLSAYLWNTGATTQCITVNSAATYTVTVTNANGCTSSCNKTVTVNTPPSCLITGNSSICSGGSTQLCAPAGLSSYLWNTGATTQCITVSATGTYTVTVANANGCTSVCHKTVGISSQMSCTITGTKPSCFNGNNGSAIVTVSGGTPAYNYLWSNGQTASQATGLSAGNYTVTVTDALGCVTSCTVTITNPTKVVVSLSKNKDVSCSNGNDGAIDANPSGGSSPYSYLWSNGATTKLNSGLAAGTYTVTVTDFNGCTATGSYTLIQPTPITATTSAIPVSCFGGNNGSALVTSATGGTSPYQFSWNTIPVKTTTGLTGVTAGTYIVTITDANGCTITKTVIVTQPPALTCTATATNTGCNASLGSVSVSASGGTPGYTYLWNTIPSKTTATVTGLGAGTYTVVVTDSKGCASICSTTILAVSGNINCSIVKTNVSCNGGNNGSATVSATGGTAPYSYLWNTNPAKTTATITGLIAGNYQVTLTDINGCTSVCSVTISQPSVLNMGFTKVVQINCFGGNTGTAEANPSGGTPGYSILWSNGQTSPFISGLSAGVYTATVTDSKGCTKSGVVTLTQPNQLSCNTTVTGIACNGTQGTASVNATGGTSPYTYSWNTSPVKTTQTITGLAPGNYVATVTDSKGCQSTCTATIGSTSSFTLNLSAIVYAGGHNIRCNGDNNGAINLTVNGASGTPAYLWSNGKTTKDINGLFAGTYTVTVTSGGCTQSSNITLTQPDVVSVSITKNNVKCNGGSNGNATANGTGGTPPYTYSWNTVPVKSTKTISGLAPGNYTVTIGDANGCTKTAVVTISQPAILTLTATLNNVSCYGGNNGSINPTAAGGTSPYTYLWNNGSTVKNRTNLPSGTYTVTVTDNKGCKKTCSFSITQPSAMICGINKNKNVSCFGGNDGKLTATVTGGKSPYTYSWNTIPVKTTATISGLLAGSYTVTITDKKGCVTTCNATISQPSALTLNISSSNVTAPGANNGTATANAAGGTSPYTYLWNTNPVKTTKKITGLDPGTYMVVVTDKKGCTKSATVTIMLTAPCQSFKSYTVSSWCKVPNGNNSGAYLNANFASAFPNGLVIGDCNYKIKLTSASAVTSFLPSTGTPRRLDAGTLLNPTSATYGNALAAQLVALKLNMTFDAFDANFAPTSSTQFKDLLIASGTFAGWTVEQLYNEANYKIGCGGSTSSYYTSLKTAIASANASWNNGANTNGFLVCPGTILRSGESESISDPVYNFELKVYPNPTSGFVNLQFNSEEIQSYQLIVMDITGRVVYTENSKTQHGFNGKFYDFTDLPKGIYVLQVTIESQVLVNRIIIQ